MRIPGGGITARAVSLHGFQWSVAYVAGLHPHDFVHAPYLAAAVTTGVLSSRGAGAFPRISAQKQGGVTAAPGAYTSEETAKEIRVQLGSECPVPVWRKGVIISHLSRTQIVMRRFRKHPRAKRCCSPSPDTVGEGNVLISEHDSPFWVEDNAGNTSSLQQDRVS